MVQSSTAFIGMDVHDRRHFDHAALPIRSSNARTRGAYVNARGVARPYSIKPYQRSR